MEKTAENFEQELCSCFFSLYQSVQERPGANKFRRLKNVVDNSVSTVLI